MSELVLYNDMTCRKEVFKPAGETTLVYGCGPTVYNLFHIGNARAFVCNDVLRRYLLYRGFKVKYVQNFTDVDDKIIRKANEEGVESSVIAERYISEYFKDADGLNIMRADVHPKATENIGGMIALVKKLISLGHAYEMDGDVYFRTRSFSDYGKLSHQSVDDLESGSRIDIDDRKEDPLDFALWKAAKPGEPSWKSPWGPGRPGWHIECSVMAEKYLGKTIDIHCGGKDLAFPHHENEIAQSESANGCEFSRFWLHNEYVNNRGVKMSKSLGNFFMTRDAAEQYGYDTVRFFIVSSHYRSPISYSPEIMDSVKTSLSRIYACKKNLDFLARTVTVASNDSDESFRTIADQSRNDFIAEMDDDINTAGAVGVIFDLVRQINTHMTSNASKTSVACAQNILNELCGVLGLTLPDPSESEDPEVLKLVEERNEARKSKNFTRADEIRDQLKTMGITLEDTPRGVRIVRN